MIPIGNGKMQLFDRSLPDKYPKELLNDVGLKQCLDSLKEANQLNPDLVIVYFPPYINHSIIELAHNQPNPADVMTGMFGIKPVFKFFHRNHPIIQSSIGESLNNDKDALGLPLFIWIMGIENEEIDWAWIPYIRVPINREAL